MDRRGTYPVGRFYKHEALRAYHEAAHAVAAISIGERIASLWILPGTEAELAQQGAPVAGRCQVDRMATLNVAGPRDKESPADLMATFAPGPAERRLRRERGWRDSWADSDMCSDFIEMINAVAVEDDPAREGKLERMRQAQDAARAFVADDDNWRAITAVALALLDTCVNRREWGMGHDAVVAAIESTHSTSSLSS